jgi:hypothetical protein
LKVKKAKKKLRGEQDDANKKLTKRVTDLEKTSNASLQQLQVSLSFALNYKSQISVKSRRKRSGKFKTVKHSFTNASPAILSKAPANQFMTKC